MKEAMIRTVKQAIAVSPCINRCTLDAARNLCQGCWRTLDEITAWSRITNTERLEILANVARRRKEFRP